MYNLRQQLTGRRVGNYVNIDRSVISGVMANRRPTMTTIYSNPPFYVYSVLAHNLFCREQKSALFPCKVCKLTIWLNSLGEINNPDIPYNLFWRTFLTRNIIYPFTLLQMLPVLLNHSSTSCFCSRIHHLQFLISSYNMLFILQAWYVSGEMHGVDIVQPDRG